MKPSKPYIAYSKRVTKWALLGVFALVVIAMILSVFVCSEQRQIDAVTKLVQYFSTLAGVVVTGYFGRASVENFTMHTNADEVEAEG